MTDEAMVEELAEAVANGWLGNDPYVHCNRMPSYNELSEQAKNQWRATARAVLASPTITRLRNPPLTGDVAKLVERLRALHVWPQFVADTYADTLLPRQIKGLYEVGETSHEAADTITRLIAERDGALQVLRLAYAREAANTPIDLRAHILNGAVELAIRNLNRSAADD